MRFKTLGGAAFGAALVLASASAAGAVIIPGTTSNATAVPSTNLVNGQTVTVSWTGIPQAVGSTTVSLMQCHTPLTDAAFDPSIDCDNVTLVTAVNNPTGANTAQFKVQAGSNEFAGFSCGFVSTGANADFAPLKPCYVRISAGAPGDRSAEAFTADLGFAPENQTNIPEVPYAVLLPLGAVAALGTGLFLNRRRTRVAA